MDYAASLGNIEILKNFIRPYNCKHIHFDFYTATEFKTQFFAEIDDDYIEKNIERCHRKSTVYARILVEKNEHEILYYFDEKFLFEINLTTNELIEFESTSHTDTKSGSVKLQMLQLIRQLKNSG